MKRIIIVESPAKVKTISKFLGPDFLVTSTMGHIRDLPSKTLGIEIKDCKVEIEYQDMDGKSKTIKNIIKMSKGVDEVLLASDPDREGEIIAFHTKEIINNHFKDKSPKIKRITYNEITKKAILESINNPRDLDEKLIEAQQARRILDRLVGYKVSPILWKKISKGLSAGRVQSVTLKLICKREEEIGNFKIKEYWSILIKFKIEKIEINSELISIDNNKDFEILVEKEASSISKDISEKTFNISSIKDSTRTRKPYAPFITSTMQQAAYNILGFNVQQTMSYAQELYEGVSIDENTVALITYMRTDSTRISSDALKDCRKYILDNCGKEYLPESSNIYSKQDAQDAHEAIRPIDISITPESIKNKLELRIFKLYNLIWKRFVASQMSIAKYSNRQILFKSNDDKYISRTSGSIITFDGFLKIYADLEEDDEKNGLPPMMNEKSSVKTISVDQKQHFTQPPARYSEASLVKELEGKRIGRPSTYVPILRTIRDRLYTVLDDKKRFVPTELGILICRVLEENMSQVMDYDFTASMEDKLDNIANGKDTRDNVICEFYKDFIKAVEKFDKIKIDRSSEETNIKCELNGCNGNFIIKITKSGQFLGCMNYPDCKNTKNFKRGETGEIEIMINKENETLDIKCPQCSKNLIKRNGKFGEFIACSGYPECKYIHQECTKAFCSSCDKYPLVKRIWRGSVYWSCKAYPGCKYGISGEIIEKHCKLCKSPFLKKNEKDNSLNCPLEGCTYKEDLE